MDLDLISDLHVDVWDFRPDWARMRGADWVVVAGDIADSVTDSLGEMARLADVYETVLVVDGNHEHHGGGGDLDQAAEALAEGIAGLANVHFLPVGPVVGDGVAFVGRLGWWDFAFGEPRVSRSQCRATYARATGDGRVCEAVAARGARHRDELVAEVTALQNRPEVDRIVVVTHTLPDPSLLSWGLYPPFDDLMGCYGTTGMGTAVTAAATRAPVVAWLFGHNHDARDEHIGGVRCVSHPRGRPMDFNRVAYRPRTLTV